MACVEPLVERLAFTRHLDLRRFDLCLMISLLRAISSWVALVRDIFIVADQLFLPHLELFDRLPHAAISRLIGGSSCAKSDDSLMGVGAAASGVACVRGAVSERAFIDGGAEDDHHQAATPMDAANREPTKATRRQFANP